MVVHTTDAHKELKTLGRGCITINHAHHYLGFARNQWELFRKEAPPRVKPLLYTYRVLLTGIHLMRTGEIEANLHTLNDTRRDRLPYIDELIRRKTAGSEHGVLSATDMKFHESEYRRLTNELAQAHESSALPNQPSARDGLNDLLLRVRRKADQNG